MKRRTRTIYKKKWECIEPGCWRSDCGRFECVRRLPGLWMFVDLYQDRKAQTYHDTLTSAAWQAVKDEWKVKTK